MSTHATELLQQYPLISDQVSRPQVHIILRELEHVLDKAASGAIVEFGCYLGTTSLFIRRLLDARGDGAQHEFHVYDSFAGLPDKTKPDTSAAGTQFQGGELKASKKDFVQEFRKAKLELPIIHKGWFGQFSARDVPESICFAFLDGDFYESIRDSLLLVLPRIQAGATIVIDDYTREALPGVARAVSDYLPPGLRPKLITEQNLGVIRV